MKHSYIESEALPKLCSHFTTQLGYGPKGNMVVQTLGFLLHRHAPTWNKEPQTYGTLLYVFSLVRQFRLLAQWFKLIMPNPTRQVVHKDPPVTCERWL